MTSVNGNKPITVMVNVLLINSECFRAIDSGGGSVIYFPCFAFRGVVAKCRLNAWIKLVALE